MTEEWSNIEVVHSGGRSRLVSNRSSPPLKLLNPRSPTTFCSVIMSNYGGGMVEGDRVQLQVDCAAGASLYLGTQALTKIYKCPNGKTTTQVIEGRIGNKGCVVALPDLVVPYAESRFYQRQEWTLEENALLFVLDGHTAGRLERGERFAYTSYQSELSATLGERKVLVENYLSQPHLEAPDRCGAMGDYAAILNAFVVGYAGEPRFESVCEQLQSELGQVIEQQLRVQQQDKRQPLLSLTKKEQVLSLRVVARRHDDLFAIYATLGKVFEHRDFLGANPLARKY